MGGGGAGTLFLYSERCLDRINNEDDENKSIVAELWGGGSNTGTVHLSQTKQQITVKTSWYSCIRQLCHII